MGEKTLNIRIKNKYDTEANWTKNNPVLLAGETAYSSDKSGKYKIGDGTHKWSELSYAKADLVKSDVTTALGYTPPTNNTWRGVQNNLTSTATDQSLSAAQGKVLKGLVDGKLPLTGGTMAGTAMITWPDSGNWSNSNKDVTFPVVRGGLSWNGQSDGIQLYAVETGNDNLELYLKFTDDNSNGLSIRNKSNIQTARIAADGTITAESFIGDLTGTASAAPWSGITGKPATYPPSSHTHNYAGSSSSGGIAWNASALYLNPQTRQTSANYDLTNSNTYAYRVNYSLATSAMTTGKPPADGHILTFGWDTDAGWGAQLCIGDAKDNHLYLRGSSSLKDSNNKNSSSWENWKTVLDSTNYNVYTPTKTGGGASGTWGISVSGNSATTTKLITARSINGTSFDGTGNITTATWGTARNITIGSTKKSVNGGADVSWSLSEIGAAASGHTHNLSTMINTLTTGDATPQDNDYYIAQYIGGGTTTTTYHRRPHSALWNYIKGKSDSTYAPKSHSHSYLPLSGGTMTGALNFANNTWNIVGNDVAIGDMNISGTLGIMGKNGNTSIKLVQKGATTTSGADAPGVVWSCTGDGASTMSGVLTGSFSGNLSGTATSANAAPWSGITGKPSTYPPSAHTHNYAGSSSAGGAATSAVKLSTARSIGLSGDASGSANFDGSGNVSISATVRKLCAVGSDTVNSAGWYKVASQTISGYGDTNAIFAVTSTYSNYYTGIFSLQIRSDNTSISCKTAKWLVRSGFPIDSIRIVISGMSWTMYVNQTCSQHGRIMFEIITQSSINSKNAGITLFNSTTKETSAPTATVTSIDGGAVAWAATAGSVSNVKDSNDGSTLTFAYSKAGLNYGDYTWIAAWNGRELRAINKNQFAQASHTHNYAGSSSAGGNANAAVKLATARSINGTNFDGSGNITTANWGTARTITVGNTGKSVNGSGNVSWSLGEIGIHVSKTVPTASDGKNGDIWIVYE